jgi:hypothetical protein
MEWNVMYGMCAMNGVMVIVYAVIVIVLSLYDSVIVLYCIVLYCQGMTGCMHTLQADQPTARGHGCGVVQRPNLRTAVDWRCASTTV